MGGREGNDGVGEARRRASHHLPPAPRHEELFSVALYVPLSKERALSWSTLPRLPRAAPLL